VPEGHDRSCIVTRKPGTEDELLRFVLSPDGEVVPDLQRKLPGRGCWVSLDRKTLAEAVKTKAFNRGFKGEAKVSTDLPERVGILLRQQALAHLSLARKAGEAVSGNTKVEEALKKGPVRVLLHAAEGSEDGIRKLDRLKGPSTLSCSLFLTDEMDLAFGRANVIHAAVAAGGLAERLVQYIQRVAKYENLHLPTKDQEAGL
jgi:predicted RNA-binding protein YlxR (DUF448 family)